MIVVLTSLYFGHCIHLIFFCYNLAVSFNLLCIDLIPDCKSLFPRLTGTGVSPEVLLHIPVLGILQLVQVVSRHLVPGQDGHPRHQADNPAQDRVEDGVVLRVVAQEQMVGLVTQSPPEPDNISELQWDIQHQVLGGTEKE